MFWKKKITHTTYIDHIEVNESVANLLVQSPNLEQELPFHDCNNLSTTHEYFYPLLLILRPLQTAIWAIIHEYQHCHPLLPILWAIIHEYCHLLLLTLWP